MYIYNVSQQSIVTRHKTCIDLYMYDGFIECFMCDTIMNKLNKYVVKDYTLMFIL